MRQRSSGADQQSLTALHSIAEKAAKKGHFGMAAVSDQHVVQVIKKFRHGQIGKQGEQVKHAADKAGSGKK